jgi:hypothetical protein
MKIETFVCIGKMKTEVMTSPPWAGGRSIKEGEVVIATLNPKYKDLSISSIKWFVYPHFCSGKVEWERDSEAESGIGVYEEELEILIDIEAETVEVDPDE